MCGIFGFASVEKKVNKKLFEESLLFIKHRGPDFQDFKEINKNVALGHTRLSILDLSSINNQPFTVEDRYTISFNGEIFNYIEIRKELESKGFSFVTSGDTEVILKSYQYWGENCVNKFNGMWAFSIYDNLKDTLFCSRDRFGIKPFCFSNFNDTLIFSSECKPILNYFPNLRKPNYNVIANFCYKGLGAQYSETWFEGIKRLLPGHNLLWEKGRVTIEKYWDYEAKIDASIDFNDSKDVFRNLVKSSINYRLRSDVNIGSTLTSGLDSSTIVGLIKEQDDKKINTYTAYSENEDFKSNDKQSYKGNVDLNEANITNKLNEDFDTLPNLIRVDFSNYSEKLKEVVYYLESGNSSFATIPMLQVYKEAKKKVKVLMEGQGADELLGGYVLDIFPYYILELLKKLKFIRVFKDLKKFKKVYSIKYLFISFFRSLDNKFINELRFKLKDINFINRKSFDYKYLKDSNKFGHDYKTEKLNSKLIEKHSGGLINLLHYGDVLSMSQGIETRLPFMDYRLVEYVFKLNFTHKIKDLKGKLLLRNSFKNILPDYIYNSKIKIGFSTPLNKILFQDEEIKNILLTYNYNDFFDNDKIKKIYEKSKIGKSNYDTLLFKILSTKIWFKLYIDCDKLELKKY